MIQDGNDIELGRTICPLEEEQGVCQDKTKRQGLAKGQMVVGRTRSTRSLGKPSTSPVRLGQGEGVSSWEIALEPVSLTHGS